MLSRSKDPSPAPLVQTKLVTVVVSKLAVVIWNGKSHSVKLTPASATGKT